jgi:hypothetical protein
VYDGKAHFDDLTRFELAAIEGNHRIFTAVVNSVSLKRNIHIAYIVKQDGKRISTALLFLLMSIYLPPKSAVTTKRGFKLNSGFVMPSNILGF